jgi:hypothetical protein
MTTSILPPFLPDVGTKRAAAILEALEEETRACGALFGLLIDRAGQIIAADMTGGPVDRERLAALAPRLVPIFLTSRLLSRKFREWPVRATIEEEGELRLVAQPILDQWLLAMAFPADGPPLPVEALSGRWLDRLMPLIPDRAAALGRLRAGAVITRDNVNLLFRDDPDEGGDNKAGSDREDA